MPNTIFAFMYLVLFSAWLLLSVCMNSYMYLCILYIALVLHVALDSLSHVCMCTYCTQYCFIALVCILPAALNIFTNTVHLCVLTCTLADNGRSIARCQAWYGGGLGLLCTCRPGCPKLHGLAKENYSHSQTGLTLTPSDGY